MFSLHDDGPASHLYILQPGYDPLIENDVLGASAPASGRTHFLPARRVRRDRAGSRSAAFGRSEARLAPWDASRPENSALVDGRHPAERANGHSAHGEHQR